jgi:hypothetical protein
MRNKIFCLDMIKYGLGMTCWLSFEKRPLDADVIEGGM